MHMLTTRQLTSSAPPVRGLPPEAKRSSSPWRGTGQNIVSEVLNHILAPGMHMLRWCMVVSGVACGLSHRRGRRALTHLAPQVRARVRVSRSGIRDTHEVSLADGSACSPPAQKIKADTGAPSGYGARAGSCSWRQAGPQLRGGWVVCGIMLCYWTGTSG